MQKDCKGTLVVAVFEIAKGNLFFFFINLFILTNNKLIQVKSDKKTEKKITSIERRAAG